LRRITGQKSVKFVVCDTIFSPATDEIKALILQGLTQKSQTPHSTEPPL
jgi:hypothetical protein